MDELETSPTLDPSDPLAVALGGAMTGVQRVMTLLTGKQSDPAIARILTAFAVGSFIKAGGMDLTRDQADIIMAMQGEILEEGGLSNSEH